MPVIGFPSFSKFKKIMVICKTYPISISALINKILVFKTYKIQPFLSTGNGGVQPA